MKAQSLIKQITRKCNDEVNRDLIEVRDLKSYEDLWRKSARLVKIEQGVGGTTELAMLRSGESTSGASINDDVRLNIAYGVQFSVSIDDDLMQEKGGVYTHALQNVHETILKISHPKSVLLKQASGKVIPDSFRLKDIKLRYESGDKTETAQSIEQMYSTGKSCY